MLAFRRARKGKTLKDYVIEFEVNLTKNIAQLHQELIQQTYLPEPLKTFIIRDPKTRKISKSAFCDRVVHHAICNIIEPLFDRRFIYDSYANRLRKGTLNAHKRFDTFKRKVSHNNTLPCYVLKADIKQYFESVNHSILLHILGRRVHDERVLRLITTILHNYLGHKPGIGMPLGNLTSQFFANVYLNELDRYVKYRLKAKYYIRYVDDFVILHRSKEQLKEYTLYIDSFLREELDITLHPEKSYILNLDKGIGFLGLRIFYYHKLIRKKNMRKFERKLKALKELYLARAIEREHIIEQFEGWLGYVSQANTYKYNKSSLIRGYHGLCP